MPAPSDARRVRDALAGVARCAWFARAAAETARRHGSGRALIVLEPAQRRRGSRGWPPRSPTWSRRGAGHDGLALCGLAADLTAAGALERVVALCDPARRAGPRLVAARRDLDADALH